METTTDTQVQQVHLKGKVDKYCYQTWRHHRWATTPDPHLLEHHGGVSFWEIDKQTRRAASRFGYHGRYDLGHTWPKNVISVNALNKHYDNPNGKIVWDHCMKPQSQATYNMDNPHLLEDYEVFRDYYVDACRQFGVTKDENETLKVQTNGRGKKYLIHCPLEYSYKEAGIELWQKDPKGDGTWNDVIPMDNLIVVPDGFTEWESQFYTEKALKILDKYDRSL